MKKEYSTFGIYRITNTINGKTYIGKTGVTFGDRWDCHRAQLEGGYHDNRHLQAAWDKYGKDAFEFAIVEVVRDVGLLNELEQKYIKEYQDVGLCYNMRSGGDGGSYLGKHLSEDTKRRIGEKNRAHMLGRKASDETKHKMSQSQKKRYESWSDEDRTQWGKMMSEHSSGYKWSDESKKKFSLIQQERPNGATLTIDEVREIRRLHEEENLTYSEISNRLGIPRHNVYLIATYRRWKNV